MRTMLRLLELSDVPELTALLRANREYLRPWEAARDDAYFTEDVQRRFAESLLAEHRRGTVVPFVVTDGSEILGRLTLGGIVRGSFQSCVMGYWIRGDRAGRGHATRAVRLATEHAFGARGLHRVQAETLVHNIASQAVLERNGFARYGRSPKYLKIDGRWQDHIMFQLLAEDRRPGVRATRPAT